MNNKRDLLNNNQPPFRHLACFCKTNFGRRTTKGMTWHSRTTSWVATDVCTAYLHVPRLFSSRLLVRCGMGLISLIAHLDDHPSVRTTELCPDIDTLRCSFHKAFHRMIYFCDANPHDLASQYIHSSETSELLPIRNLSVHLILILRFNHMLFHILNHSHTAPSASYHHHSSRTSTTSNVADILPLANPIITNFGIGVQSIHMLSSNVRSRFEHKNGTTSTYLTFMILSLPHTLKTALAPGKSPKLDRLAIVAISSWNWSLKGSRTESIIAMSFVPENLSGEGRPDRQISKLISPSRKASCSTCVASQIPFLPRTSSAFGNSSFSSESW